MYPIHYWALSKISFSVFSFTFFLGNHTVEYFSRLFDRQIKKNYIDGNKQKYTKVHRSHTVDQKAKHKRKGAKTKASS